MKTGDTRDPMTRETYSDEVLHRLDLQAKKHYPEIHYSSTLKIKKNINYAKRIRNRENEILSYQTRMDELKEIVVTFVKEGIFFWNLSEPFVIDSVEYKSTKEYTFVVLDELKLIYSRVKEYSHFEAEAFKVTFLENIGDINEIIQRIKNF